MTDTHAALLEHPRLAVARRRVEQLDAAAHRVVTQDETCRVVWRRWGQGPGLILLHGAYGSWLHWAANIVALSASHTVWVPDIPGFGDSVLFDRQNVSLEKIGAAMAWMVEDLRIAGQVKLLAFSFGTRLAADMAITRPALFDAVMLVGPMGFAERVPLAVEPKRWCDIEDIEDIEGMLAVQHHNLLALMLHDPARADDLAVYIQMRNTFRTRVIPKAPVPGSIYAALQAAGLPVHILWGQRDAYHGPLLAQRRERVGLWLSQVTVETLPDVGHWAMYEQPAAFERFFRAAISPEAVR